LPIFCHRADTFTAVTTPAATEAPKKKGFFSFLSTRREKPSTEPLPPASVPQSIVEPVPSASEAMRAPGQCDQTNTQDASNEVQPESSIEPTIDIFAGMSQKSVEASASIVTTPLASSSPITEHDSSVTSKNADPVVGKVDKLDEQIDASDEDESRIGRLNKIARKEISTFSDEFMEISAKHCMLLSTTKDLTSERHQLDDELKGISISIAESEEEQQRLAQIEEFEKADALSAVLDSLRRRSKVVEDRIEQVIELLISIHLEMDQIYSLRSSTLSRMLDRFKNLVTEQQLEREKLEKKRDLYTESEDARLRVEEQRVALEKMHVDKEDSSVQEDKKVIEDAISAQLTDVSSTRADYEARLLSVSTEIRELEAKLAAKREEEQQLQAEVETLDVRVREVRKKYDRQLTRLEDRQSALEKSKSECLQEGLSIAEERKLYEHELAEQTQVIDHIGNWIKAVGIEDIVLNKIKSVLSDNQPSTSMEAESSVDLFEMRKRCSETNSLIQQSLNEKDALEAQIKQLQEEDIDLDEKIPKLEAEKKSHAAARRFKEAGIVAKDIKDMMVRADEIKAEVQETQRKVSTNLDAFTILQKAYDEELSRLHEVEKESELRNFNTILTRAKRLHKVKLTVQQLYPPLSFEDVADAASLSPDDVLGNNGGVAVHYMIRENSMRILDSELDGLVNELSILGAKFGLDTYLGNDVDDDSTNQVSDQIDAQVHDNAQLAISTPVVDVDCNYTAADIDIELQPAEDNSLTLSLDNSEEAPMESVVALATELQLQAASLLELIEMATEAEDYEKAAELDAQLVEVNQRIESLNNN